MRTLYTRLKLRFAREWAMLLGLLVLLPLTVGLLIGFWSGSRLTSFHSLEEIAPSVVEHPVQPPSPARQPSLGASGGEPGRSLEYRWSASGTRGEDVKKVQSRLLSLAGQPVQTPSGVFDLRTQRGVFEFQVRQGLPPTGEVDAATWQALFAGSP